MAFRKLDSYWYLTTPFNSRLNRHLCILNKGGGSSDKDDGKQQAYYTGCKLEHLWITG